MLRTHAGHQPKEIDAEIRRLLGELVDLREQQRMASSKEDDVISRLQGALGHTGHSTQRGLFEGGKLSRWGNSVSSYNPDNGALHPWKRARQSS
jgi:hypothetical protein